MVAVAAACGHGDGSRSTPVVAHLAVAQVAGPLVEYEPSHWTFQVLDSSGAPVSGYDGSVTISSGLGRPITPSTIPVLGGFGEADLVFGVAGGDDLVSFSTAGVTTSQYLFIDAKPPMRIAGPLPDGAVFAGASGWNSDGAWAASVLKDPAGFRMYYASSNTGGAPNIGLATSTDGLHWTAVGPAPLVGPAVLASPCHPSGAENPNVRRTAAGFEMIYRGLAGSRGRLCRATSPDGAAWTLTAGPQEDGSVLAPSPVERFDDVSLISASVLEMTNGSLATIYASYGTGEVFSTHAGAEHVTGFGFASSGDGVTWTKVPGGNLLDALKLSYSESPFAAIWNGRGEGASCLIQDGAFFRVWVTGSSDIGQMIGYYTSNEVDVYGPDVDNELVPYDSVLYLGGTGMFDETGTSFPSVVDGSDGVRRLYYTGLSAIGRRAIGVTEIQR